MLVVDPCVELSAFVPNSAFDGQESCARLTLRNASQIMPFLSLLCENIHGKAIEPIPAEAFLPIDATRSLADTFATILNSYGSDKAAGHNYHTIYAAILRNTDQVHQVLEIGLGTNNLDVASNMGSHGRPGASLRAFRDFLPNAHIFGADIDSRILFSEPRIETFAVDQTSLESLEQLGAKLPGEFDLIVDDGLHAQNANVATMNFALRRIKTGGWFVVEDIPERALATWKVVKCLFTDQYRAEIVKTQGAYVFVVRRVY